MTDLAAILPIVSRSSALTLGLYQLPIAANATNNTTGIAKSINEFSLIIKQVGTIIKENDRLPSSEAIETLQDIVEQCTAILSEIEDAIPLSSTPANEGLHYSQSSRGPWFQPSPVLMARLDYLVAHLNSLKSTLSVLLQTLHTAQSIVWARVRPTISPKQAAMAMINEKAQLETLIIEQQLSILSATKIYEPSRSDVGLLMEQDSSQSLVAVENAPSQPAHLFRYQDEFLAGLDTSDAGESEWLPAVCGNSKSHLESILARWTRLRQFEERLQDAERTSEAKKRETQQASVESDSEDDFGSLPDSSNSDTRQATPKPSPPDNTQPLSAKTTPLPIPVPGTRYGPTAPLSPASSFAASPSSSAAFLASTTQTGYTSTSPRSSISSQPISAAAAISAKSQDDDVALEIPWTLCTPKHYWKHIDGTVTATNTTAPPSAAFSDRNSWTEILASWVCRKAIREARYKYTQVQKEGRDGGRRTAFETCFCIQQALTFDQVLRLVERTVEIYRQTRPPSPSPPAPPPLARTSFERPAIDRDRTLRASHQPHQPPLSLESSTTSFPFPPPPPPGGPPPLDRATSMPGPSAAAYPYAANPQASIHHLPLIPQGSYPPHAAPYASYAAHPAPFSPTQPAYTPHLHRPPSSHARPQPPQQLPHPASNPNSSRPSFPSSPSSPALSSDSDIGAPTATRSRATRSRSRRPAPSHNHSHSHSYKKKASHKGTVGALVGVGGLTALLDGLVGL
ncbi:hypothetical protein BDV95DRAFT_590454 [Massariosphaeria phaeospora]|uniref:Fungal N-terminal domain-containing protein n=1 Tax=Massariosphaeria phaeospora TaxID=100035 RepID=A0A7C8ICM6_9PLEO|nr:hypothetical protein BDV95DRAFT_590454 [Massariosphaeria phaeospora]